MNRTKKLYASLDVLASSYLKLLVNEFEKGEGRNERSLYLDKKHMAGDDKGRIYCIHDKAGDLTEINELLGSEKEIRQLCDKLNEPLPFPIQVLDEYIDAYRNLMHRHPWDACNLKGEYKQLKLKTLEKLLKRSS